jgi:endonuclease-8
MPEGDTIFRAASALHRALAGRAVTRFETGLAQLANVDRDVPIAGRTVEQVFARGKHLLIQLSGPLTLRTHMRMNGSWHLYRPGERWRRPRSAMRVALHTEAFVAVGFDIPVADFLNPRQLARDPDLSQLGPDLLSPDFDRTEALSRLRARAATEVALALLTQRVMAGLGNVYKSEVLFLEGVHPCTKVGLLDEPTLLRLIDRGQRLIGANVRNGAPAGIVTYGGLRRTTGRSDPSERLWVYGRRGQPCRRCSTPILLTKQGLDARVTYWCPSCQPLPEGVRAPQSLGPDAEPAAD